MFHKIKRSGVEKAQSRLYYFTRPWLVSSNSTHLSQVLPESDKSSSKCNSTHIVHVWWCIYCTFDDNWRTWIVIQCFFSFWCRIPFAARIFICKTTSLSIIEGFPMHQILLALILLHPILLGKFTFFYQISESLFESWGCLRGRTHRPQAVLLDRARHIQNTRWDLSKGVLWLLWYGW